MSTANDNVLKPVNIGLLYEGMTVHDNIYDSTGDRMLLIAGSVLTSDHIDRMHRLNGGSQTIYVSGRTHTALQSKRPNIPQNRRLDIEESTGYLAAFIRVSELYKPLISTKKVNRNGFVDASAMLAKLLRETPPADIMSLVNAIAPAAGHVQRHLVNVALLNGLIGMWLQLPDERIDTLVLIGLLHDVGHALMPQGLLYSHRKFNGIEQQVIKMHTVRTVELLADFPEEIHLTAGSHHERIDGSGYPKGIAGDDVSGAARITAISDIYEGIVTSRSHRPARDPFRALSILDDMAPDLIDGVVVGTVKKNLPPLLIDKPVTMSDGTIGIIREFDDRDIEYPLVEISKNLIKTNEKLHCVSMYNDE